MIEQILSEIPKQKTFTDKDKPLLETTMIFAHNAYNSNAYGAYFLNQGMSITEVLDLGISGVELDVYFDNGELRLCHLLCADYGIGTSLKMSDALNEIAQWIAKH